MGADFTSMMNNFMSQAGRNIANSAESAIQALVNSTAGNKSPVTAGTVTVNQRNQTSGDTGAFDADLYALGGNAKNATEAYHNAIQGGSSVEEARDVAAAFGKREASLRSSEARDAYGYSDADLSQHLNNKANAYGNSVPTGTFTYDGQEADKVINDLSGVTSGAKTSQEQIETMMSKYEPDSLEYQALEESRDKCYNAQQSSLFLQNRMRQVRDDVRSADDAVIQMVLNISMEQLNITAMGNSTTVNYSSTSDAIDAKKWGNYGAAGVIGNGKQYISGNTGGSGGLGVDDILRGTGDNRGEITYSNGNVNERYVWGYDAETGKGGVVVDKPEAESNNIEETGSDTTTVGSDGTKIRFRASDYDYNSGASGQAGGLNMQYSKTTYTDASTFPWSSSKDWYSKAILDDAYIDENGLYRIQKNPGVNSADDYYCVAMGARFLYEDSIDDGITGNQLGSYAGYTYKVEVQSASGETKTMDVIFTDAKGDNNSYVPHDHVIEFEIDASRLSSSVSSGGNVDFGKLLFNGDVAAVTGVDSYGVHLYEGACGIGWSRV